MTATTHYLKCWPEFFDAVERGDKTFEIRKNDRGFQRGDVLVLRKYDPFTSSYVSPEGAPRSNASKAATVTVAVSYVLSDYGLQPGYVCMAIAEVVDP
jgi:hypothetical protein